MKGVEVNLGGEDVELLPENVGIAMFRNTPELDYLDYHVPVENVGIAGERHIIIFRQRELFIWMGGIALTEQDAHVLRRSESKMGAFTLLSGGWRPEVCVTDSATAWEVDMYVQSILGDDLEDIQGALDRLAEDELTDDES